jgi:hypothetical protein
MATEFINVLKSKEANGLLQMFDVQYVVIEVILHLIAPLVKSERSKTKWK